MLLSSQDLEDILGRQPSPAPAAAAAASAPSPPPSRQPLRSSTRAEPPALPSPEPAAAASSAAAAAMSSGSKLRAAIMNKRKNMSVLNPNVKRREPSKGIKIGTQHREEEEAAAIKPPPPSKQSPTQRAATAGAQAARERDRAEEVAARREKWIAQHGALPDLAAQRLLHPDWWAAEEAKAEQTIAKIVKAEQARARVGGAGVSDSRQARIRWNTHYLGYAARQQRFCSGTEKDGSHASAAFCQSTPFRPEDLFSGAVASLEFAHWERCARGGENGQLVTIQLRSKEDFDFVDFVREQGRLLRPQCHAIETYLD